MNIRRILTAAVGAAILAIPPVAAEPAYADSTRDQQWYLSSLDIAQTRSISTGAGVVVAVIDTGSYPHPDLRDNLLTGKDLVGGQGNGQTDTASHGTRMAALIAAHGKSESDGLQGIAPSAKILPIRISKTDHDFASVRMTAAVKWAVGKGAKVINISGGVGPSFGLQDAVDAAIASDVVIVAAIGNTTGGASIGTFPAAFDGVLAVGATGRDGNFDPLTVKSKNTRICAPGVDIMSAEPKDEYWKSSGPSDSSAITAGAAALVRAKFPNLSAKEVVERLTSTADDIGPPGRDNECGFGRLNIVKALSGDAPVTGATATAAPGGGGSAAPGSTAEAAPRDDAGSTPASRLTPLLLGGLALVVALVLIGGLVVGLVVWRRRSS